MAKYSDPAIAGGMPRAPEVNATGRPPAHEHVRLFQLPLNEARHGSAAEWTAPVVPVVTDADRKDELIRRGVSETVACKLSKTPGMLQLALDHENEHAVAAADEAIRREGTVIHDVGYRRADGKFSLTLKEGTTGTCTIRAMDLDTSEPPEVAEPNEHLIMNIANAPDLRSVEQLIAVANRVQIDLFLGVIDLALRRQPALGRFGSHNRKAFDFVMRATNRFAFAERLRTALIRRRDAEKVTARYSIDGRPDESVTKGYVAAARATKEAEELGCVKFVDYASTFPANECDLETQALAVEVYALETQALAVEVYAELRAVAKADR